MKKNILLILPVLFILAGLIYTGYRSNITEFSLNKNLNDLNTPAILGTTAAENKPESSDVPRQTSTTAEVILPGEKNISVPFADQAPYKDWGDPYQEACEETSIIMAKAFVDGNISDDLDKNYINEEILKLVAYQDKNWGGHHDLDTALTVKLMSEFYGINAEIKNINSIDDIKNILAEGKIIIAPTYGKKLVNPNFTAPGPVYHMLVIKGYDTTQFITNDPGVWQGKNFQYSQDNLFDAIVDLPQEAAGKKGYIKSHEELMQSQVKNVIVI